LAIPSKPEVGPPTYFQPLKVRKKFYVIGQFRLRLAEVDGKLTGNEMKLPLCMGVASSQTDAAWGNGHLAVATVNHGSGVARSAVCITLMKCQ